MKKLKWFIFSCGILFCGCSNNDPVQIAEMPSTHVPVTSAEQIVNAEWDVNKVAPGVSWKYHHFDNLFNSSQSVTVFEINDPSETANVEIPYVESGFLKTSDAAVRNRALLAINGSYFDTKNGGSTVFFKKNGLLINKTRSNFNFYRENAGLAVDISGRISIIDKPSSGWEGTNYYSLLVSGPLLIYKGALVNQEHNKFNDNRHPRTALGITAGGKIIAVVVDGRAAQAQGVNMGEMAEIMEALGCVEAMNLDGGGSSTAWVMNRGVVNYPSDNKKFDHRGERGVATVIAFLPR